MRIISGALKGKSIRFLKNSNTRPLKNSVKENIFNILIHSNLIDIKIEKANILDLYSGIGSFGIECISRAAQKVTFIEKDKAAAEILQKNLIQLNIVNKTVVLNNKIEDILKFVIKKKFTIIFSDPPFVNNDYLQNLKFIKENKMFNKKHILIIHREKKSHDNLDDFIDVILIKNYGRSKIIFGFFK